jgi:hypothetical protein
LARYNEILTGRFNRALQKILSMKGDAVAPQLAGEIQPSVVFPTGAEFRYLEQWNLFSISSQVSEVGGVSATRARLRNPAGSNVIGVVQFMLVASSVNDVIRFILGPTAGDLPTVLTAQRLDARAQTGQGTLRPSTDTSGAPGSPQIGNLIVLANTSYNVMQDGIHEIPLLPGDMLEINPNTVAAGTQLTFWWMWRERFLEESERT